MAVVDWTSEGMEWSTVKGKLPYPYIEALRQALLERASIMSKTVPSILSSPVSSDFSAILGAWGIAFETLLDEVVAGTVDGLGDPLDTWHKPDQDLHGESDNPSWGMTDILAYLGQSRITVDVGYPTTAAWAKQQYDILNQLTWTKRTGKGWGGDSDEHFARTTGLHATFADAVTEFNTLPWVSIGSPGGAEKRLTYIHASPYTTLGYRVTATKSTLNITGLPAPTLDRTVKAYLFFPNPIIGAIGTLQPFDSGDLGIGENEFALIDEIATPFASGALTLTSGAGLTDNQIVGPPAVNGIWSGCFSHNALPTTGGEYKSTLTMNFTYSLEFVA